MNLLCKLAAILTALSAINIAIMQYKPEWNLFSKGANINALKIENKEKAVKYTFYVCALAAIFLLASCVLKADECKVV